MIGTGLGTLRSIVRADKEQSMMTLLDACREVMRRVPKSAYPDGLSSADVLKEIRVLFGPDAFPLVSVIDVADEMRSFYGPGR